jgi:hypothetical protein
MTLFVSLSRSQMKAELAAYGMPVPQGGDIASFLAADDAPPHGEATPVQWPDELDAEATLRMLLSEPLCRVRTFSADAAETNLVFATDGEASLAVLSLAGGRAALAGDLSVTRLAATLGETLGVVQSAPPPPFSIALGRDGAMVLFALIDWIRLLAAASLVERTGLQSIAARPADLAEQLERGASAGDYRWLCALLPQAMGESANDPARAVPAGCEELARCGLLTIMANGDDVLYHPSAALASAALNLLIPLPALIVERDPADGICALVSGRSMWSLRREDHGVVFECVDGLTALAVIGGELASCCKRSSAGPREVADDRRKSPGRTKPAKPPDDTERRTGRAAPGGAASSPAVCASCGAKRIGEAKFCTRCGVKL